MNKEKAEEMVKRLLANTVGLKYGSASVTAKLHDGRIVSVAYSTTVHTMEPKVEKEKINDKTRCVVKAVIKPDIPDKPEVEIKTDFGTPDILSRKEAAKFLGICMTTLDRLDIPRTKILHRVMFKRDIIKKWIDDNTEKNKN
jgi:hypothetical protein